MKKIKNNEKIIIALAVALILLLGLVLYSQSSPSTSTPQQINPSNEAKLYTSKNLKFSLQIPTLWRVTEDQTFTDLTSQDGKINVSRIATNFDNVNAYLADFDSKRTIKIASEEKMLINGYDSIKREERFIGGTIAEQKVYYIYIRGWIYSLSTSSKELYSDLDQIARSFRYIP